MKVVETNLKFNNKSEAEISLKATGLMTDEGYGTVGVNGILFDGFELLTPAEFDSEGNEIKSATFGTDYKVSIISEKAIDHPNKFFPLNPWGGFGIVIDESEKLRRIKNNKAFGTKLYEQFLADTESDGEPKSLAVVRAINSAFRELREIALAGNILATKQMLQGTTPSDSFPKVLLDKYIAMCDDHINLNS